MRVFQRGVDECLVIGQDVVVTVLDVQPDSVRLGISDSRSSPSYWEQTLYFGEDDLDEEGSSLELATVVC